MKRVLIIEPVMTHYRLPFYEALHARLAGSQVELRVAYSEPAGPNPAPERSAAVDLPASYGMKVPAAYFAGSRIVWQPLLREVRDADLVVIDHANRFLLNHFLPWIQNLYAPLTDSLGIDDLSAPEFMRGRGLNWYLFLNSLFSSHPVYWFVGKGGSVPTGWEDLFGSLSANEPHSDYIRLLHDYGFIGLSLYLWILVRFLNAARALRRHSSWLKMALGNSLIVATFGVLFLSLTSEPSRYPSAISYLFVLGASAFATISLMSRRPVGQIQNEIS